MLVVEEMEVVSKVELVVLCGRTVSISFKVEACEVLEVGSKVN